jgi:hypothetical protein
VPNPSAIAEGGSNLKLDLVTNAAGTVGLKRGYDAGTPTGSTAAALAQGVVLLEAGVGAVDTDAAAALSAALPAVSAKVNYLAGFSISGRGATAAIGVEATITGLAIGTMRVWVPVPAGATLAIAPIFVTFPNPIPASAANTAITLAVPSFGTGNTDAECAIWGFVSA